MMRKQIKGQSTLEFSILLIVVMAAIITTQQYIKRGVQGRWKESIDVMGEQYDPRTVISNTTHSLTSSTNTQIMALPGSTPGGYWTQRTDQTISDETVTGNSLIGAY